MKRYAMAGEEHEVRYRHTRGGPVADGVQVIHVDASAVVLETDGVRRRFEVARHGDRVWVNGTALTALPRFPDPTAQQAPAPCSRPCRARSSRSPTASSPDRVSGPVNRCCGSKR